MKYSFISDLDIKSCENVIKQLIEQEAYNGVQGKIGKTNNKFWIKKRSLTVHNSFQRSFYGRFTSLDDKTIITGDFKLDKVVNIFIAYFNVFLLFIEVVIIFDLIRSLMISDKITSMHDIKVLFIPVGMVALQYLMIYVFIKLNIEEEKHITKILQKRLKAREYN